MQAAPYDRPWCTLGTGRPADDTLSDPEFADGFVGGRTSPSWFIEGNESAPLVGIHVANKTCNRAAAMRLAWAAPLTIGLFVVRSRLFGGLAARRKRRTAPS